MQRLVWLVLVTACGGGSSPSPDASAPTEIPFGTTAIVVVVNPGINDANRRNNIPTPGAIREGVTLTTDDNVTATTGPDGIAILAPVTPGMRSITVSGAVAAGPFTVMVADRTLREVALATDAGRAQLMVNVDYKSDQALEVNAAMTNAQVNSVLAVSDRVVFVRGGVYVGDLDFSGSRVTLFGEGALGGKVTIQGNITVSGSDSRIRGTRITGNLTIPASGVGLSFSRVDGTATSMGSDGMLLASSLCGPETVSGSGTVVVGNLGAAPLAACPP